MPRELDIGATMMEPGGTYACPVDGCNGLLFHLYEDDGALVGMTCCFCDHHEFEGVNSRRPDAA
jgi:hypothetical protein